MNGVHDMGGVDGFGPVDPTDDEPFHHEWEQRVHGLSVVLGVHGLYTTDESRHLREQLHPVTYLSAGYWEQRLIPLERKLEQLGILNPGEVDERMEQLDHIDLNTQKANPDLLERVTQKISSTSSFDREPKSPRFAVDDSVIARNIHPDGHCRLPRYVRRAQGTVIDFHGTQMFPDAAAEGNPAVGEPLYSVQFDARELWGDDHPYSDTVVLQLFEPYLSESNL